MGGVTLVGSQNFELPALILLNFDIVDREVGGVMIYNRAWRELKRAVDLHVT